MDYSACLVQYDDYTLFRLLNMLLWRVDKYNQYSICRYKAVRDECVKRGLIEV